MRFLWLPVAFVGLACDGRVLNVGGDGGGVGPADASSDGIAHADATLPDDATVLADGAVVVPPGGMRLGDFTGYFEDYMFPSGSRCRHDEPCGRRGRRDRHGSRRLRNGLAAGAANGSERWVPTGL